MGTQIKKIENTTTLNGEFIFLNYNYFTEKKLNELYQKFVYFMKCMVVNSNIWTVVSKEFYNTFWCLSIDDIYVPVKLYKTYINELEDRTHKLKAKRNISKKRESVYATQWLYRLKKEINEKFRKISYLHKILSVECQRWFNIELLELIKNQLNPQKRISTIVKEMLLPRCIYSPADAYFCAKFIYQIHYLNIPGFNIYIYYSNNGVIGMIRASGAFTEVEAKNFGIFFRESIKIAFRWAKKKKDFERETWNKVKLEKWFQKKKKIGYVSHLNEFTCHEYFFNFYYKYFSVRIMDFAINSILSSDYLLNTNTINILFEILIMWPNEKKYVKLLDASYKLMQREDKKRTDVSLLAKRYLLEIKKKCTYPHNL